MATRFRFGSFSSGGLLCSVDEWMLARKWQSLRWNSLSVNPNDGVRRVTASSPHFAIEFRGLPGICWISNEQLTSAGGDCHCRHWWKRLDVSKWQVECSYSTETYHVLRNEIRCFQTSWRRDFVNRARNTRQETGRRGFVTLLFTL